MNLEAINKWLDEEYGCSFTKLEELHNFYFEKYCDLKQENQKQKEVIDKINEFIKELYDNTDDIVCYEIDRYRKEELLDILKGVSE